MTKTNKASLNIPSFFGRCIHFLKLRFTRHEAWSLNAARQAPLFAMFPVFILILVWVFVPMIPLGIIILYLLYFSLFSDVFGAIFLVAFGLFLFVIVMPWFFRWYFICVGLMIRRTRMAQKKEAEILARLERLQG